MPAPSALAPLAPESDALLAQLELFGMRLGLERIRQWLDELGNPHLAVPMVLIGGTNGKGSTSALLAAMCRAAGYRTGLYTSPHLESVTERIALDGRQISDAELAALLREILELAARQGVEPPTYFEALTLAAWQYFQRQGAALGVMEVGLGGRLDATNAGEPLLSVITSLDLDHQQQLGNTLAAIAHEKAGIFRRGRPAIAWGGDPQRTLLLTALAQAHGADLQLVDQLTKRQVKSRAGVLPQRVRIKTQLQTYTFALPLAGAHQIRNLAVAVRAAEQLAERGFPRLERAGIEAGVASCRWPGRLEWVTLGDGRKVLLDSAHNPAGIATLKRYLQSLEGPFDLLFGALADKDIAQMLGPLTSVVERIVLTRPASDRAGDPASWSAFLSSHPAEIVAAPQAALSHALATTRGQLVICGSIYLIGEVRQFLRQQFGVPARDSSSFSSSSISAD